MDSRRRTITRYIVEELKAINGGVSAFDPTYTYHTNVFNNVYNEYRFLDQVNDFPSIYVTAGTEVFDYDTLGSTTAILDIVFRCYAYEEAANRKIDDLLEDIDHVIRHISDYNDMGVMQIEVQDHLTDSGLLDPYGMAEMTILIQYQSRAL